MQELLNPDNPYAGVNLVIVLVFVLLSAVFFICFSGFVKYNIILNIIKNAVGTQQIPPTIVVNLLAALMALNSIWPDIKPGIERIKPYFLSQTQVQQRGEIGEKYQLSKPFVLPNSFELPGDTNQNETEPGQKTLFDIASNAFDYFPELLERAKNKTEKLTSIIKLPLNFDQSNITVKYLLGNLLLDLFEGFQMGIKLYLVFVSIDFLIATILTGVGMNMLSPTVISTPVKLAVFYFSDSWTILFRTLH